MSNAQPKKFDGAAGLFWTLLCSTAVAGSWTVYENFIKPKTDEVAPPEPQLVEPDAKKAEHVELRRFIVSDAPEIEQGTPSQTEIDCKTGLVTMHSDKSFSLTYDEQGTYEACFNFNLSSFRASDDAKEKKSAADMLSGMRRRLNHRKETSLLLIAKWVW